MITEDQLEQLAIQWFQDTGWNYVNGKVISPEGEAPEREDFRSVVLKRRLAEAVGRLNPKLPPDAVAEVVHVVLTPEHISLVHNNRDFHRMLLNGVRVEYNSCDKETLTPTLSHGEKEKEMRVDSLSSWERAGVRVIDHAMLIDFQNPENNDFLVVNQLTVVGTKKPRRPDLVCFVNGLPLGLLELKNPADTQADVWKAFTQLQTYKEEISDLLVFNEALVVSDGMNARVGSLTASEEWFMPWRTVANENDKPKVEFELENVVRGFFRQDLFLDYVRYFILYEDDGGGLIKKIAGYHQFHGVREAVRVTMIAAQNVEDGKLREDRAAYGKEVVPGSRKAGVFWHTQGSGKSISMCCYSGMLLQQPDMNNPTLVVVTDRNDLDGQLFTQFCSAKDLLKQTPEQADSRTELREMLASRQAGGIIFTTVQKFGLDRASEAPSSSALLPGGEGSKKTHYRGGFSYAGLLKRARELRNKQTPAEEVMWSMLRNKQLAGAKFRRQHQFGDYICDFYCNEATLVVECDGAAHDSDEAKAHDKKRDAYFKSQGLKVLRFQNHTVINETETVLRDIASQLPSPSGRGAGGEGAVEGLALNTRTNIGVISDEAHRSQYGLTARLNTKTGVYDYGYAKHMRDALPLASFIGFTGTPIEKADANTQAVFGGYVSVYDIEDAKNDKATVPIYYESRLAKLDINREEIDALNKEVDEVMEDEEDTSTRESTKGKWAQLAKLVGADERLQEVAEDLVEHFETRTATLEGKAMIVAMSREICVEFFRKIIKLRPEWAGTKLTKDGKDAGWNVEDGAIRIVMTGTASDAAKFQDHMYSKGQKKRLEARFKDPKDGLKLVIVRDMWLTGFDAPCCHTMYVDKPMAGHNLMQAIARVNRVFKGKEGGLVVDYIGIAAELKNALAIYTQAKGKGKMTLEAEQALGILLEKVDVLRGLFHGFDYSKFETKALLLLPDATNHILGLESEDERDGKKRFLDAMAAATVAYSLCSALDGARALQKELAFFSAIAAVLRKHGTTDKKRTEDQKNTALKQILDNAVKAEDVQDIFQMAGLDRPNIGLLSDEFLEDVRRMERKNLAVELLERLLKDKIKAQTRNNLVQEKKYSDRLIEALRKYHNRMIESSQVIAEMIQMAKDMQTAMNRHEELGLNPDEEAFYDALADRPEVLLNMGDATLKKLASELTEKLRNSTTVDWQFRESVRARMRILIRQLLRKYKYPPEGYDDAIALVMQQAEELAGAWTEK